MQRIMSHNEQDTYKAGNEIAKTLQKGDVICLTGDLGAGKTTLSKAIAKGLNIKEIVTSPTFTIVKEYEGDLPLYHFDVYRMEGIEDMYEMGFEEYLFGEGVCLIEWADKISEILPQNSIWIHMDYGEEIEERIITITGLGVIL